MHMLSFSLTFSLVLWKPATRNPYFSLLISSLSPSFITGLASRIFFSQNFRSYDISCAKFNSFFSCAAASLPITLCRLSLLPISGASLGLNCCIVPLPCHVFKITEAVFSPFNSTFHRFQSVFLCPHFSFLGEFSYFSSFQ